MLTTLTLDGYRSFRHYEINGLGRVNLFVGQNGCGKTSLLEAVEFLASKGSPNVLLRSSADRGEQSPMADNGDPPHPWTSNIAHLFHGHDIESETENGIRIAGTPGHGPITVHVRSLTPSERNRVYGDLDEAGLDDSPLGLEITGSYLRPDPVFAIGRNGDLRSRRLLGTEAPTTRGSPTPARFVAPRTLSAYDLRRMWDEVQMSGRESEVLDIVRVAVPDLVSLHFLSIDRSGTPSDRGIPPATGVLARLRNEDRRVPLGGLGDGIHQLLALSLSLNDTADGFLLADGLDSSLHWTVMRDLWKAVIDASRRSSVQVLATTQSLDALRGLSALYRKSPEEASEVTVFKMDRRLPMAVRLDADNVDAAIGNDIEIR